MKINVITKQIADKVGIDFDTLIKLRADDNKDPCLFAAEDVLIINSNKYPNVPKYLYGFWKIEGGCYYERGSMASKPTISLLERVEQKTRIETYWAEVE